MNARIDEQTHTIEAQRSELDELRVRLAHAEMLQQDVARLARELSDLRGERANVASRSR